MFIEMGKQSSSCEDMGSRVEKSTRRGSAARGLVANCFVADRSLVSHLNENPEEDRGTTNTGPELPLGDTYNNTIARAISSYPFASDCWKFTSAARRRPNHMIE